MNKKMTTCRACSQEIAKSAKSCPHCGAKNKKPIFKKWWFWAIIVVIVIAIGTSGNDADTNDITTNNPSSSQSTTPDNSSSNQNTTPNNNDNDNNASTGNETKAPAKTKIRLSQVLFLS